MAGTIVLAGRRLIGEVADSRWHVAQGDKEDAWQPVHDTNANARASGRNSANGVSNRGTTPPHSRGNVYWSSSPS
jgi:hypothetical protein